MNFISEPQGSQAWLDIRAKHFTASEAPAMMGASKYMSRSALLRQKHTGLAEEVDEHKQRLFDRGHEAEAAARSIAEGVMEAELYPVTGTLIVDGLPLLASFDGLTMMEDRSWENKLWNDELAEAVRLGELEPHYYFQLEQQLLVSGADIAYFTCSDGTPERTVGMWYESKPERRAALIAGWKQFAKDLAEYQHVDKAPAAVAETIEDLPALTVQLVGQVTASNLATFQHVVLERIKAINTTLVTDADFANADKMVKFLDDGEKKLELVKSQALSQTASIDELFRTIDGLKVEMRSKRLTLDKLVKAEKDNRRAEIVSGARTKLSEHIEALHKKIGVSAINISGTIFADAIKGLKSLDSMRDKVSAALANAKIEANAIADRIEFNQKQMAAKSAFGLFPDFQNVCTKDSQDFAALLSMRLQQQKEADEKRLEAERERIHAEVIRKAQQELAAQARKEAEERERLAKEQARQEAEKAKAAAPAPTPAPTPSPTATPAPTPKAECPTSLIATPQEALVADILRQLVSMTEDQLQLVLHYCERIQLQKEA